MSLTAKTEVVRVAPNIPTTLTFDAEINTQAVKDHAPARVRLLSIAEHSITLLVPGETGRVVVEFDEPPGREGEVFWLVLHNFLKSGAHLDAYRIRRWKGGGAYGDVYEGEKHGRPYALKLTKHRQSSDDPGKTYQRQLRELVCLVQLDHPNIVKVLGWARTEAG